MRHIGQTTIDLQGFKKKKKLEKVFLQTNLERNLSNFSYIPLLYVNFENITVELHILIIFSIFAKRETFI